MTSTVSRVIEVVPDGGVGVGLSAKAGAAAIARAKKPVFNIAPRANRMGSPRYGARNTSAAPNNRNDII
jgi:hypothetical protein